jgi:hypothetical protein
MKGNVHGNGDATGYALFHGPTARAGDSRRHRNLLQNFSVR